MTWTIDAHDNRVHHAGIGAAEEYVSKRLGEHAIVPCLCGSTDQCWVCQPTTNGDNA